jgi:hypothetical protein
MPMLQRRGSAKRKHDARVAWLSVRPDRYAGVPGLRDDVTAENRAALDGLVTDMGALGLLGGTTQTQRETVRRLVSELRGESVGGGW